MSVTEERIDRLERAVLGLARMEFYSQDQPRDEKGQWSSDGGSSSEGDAFKQAISAGRVSDALGSKGNPIKVSSATVAANLINQGKYVQMPPEQVSILINKLADIGKEAKAIEKETGVKQKTPDYNLCQISVPDTNLFCADNKGIERIKMPQLTGEAVPGSKAEGLAKDDHGEVDAAPAFQQALHDAGITMTREDVPANMLKSTQNELVGTKVAGQALALEGIFSRRAAGETVPKGGLEAPIFVSNDNYIVDGHHRWAATVAADYNDGKLDGLTMPVTRVDMPISELLDYTRNFADRIGIKSKAG